MSEVGWIAVPAAVVGFLAGSLDIFVYVQQIFVRPSIEASEHYFIIELPLEYNDATMTELLQSTDLVGNSLVADLSFLEAGLKKINSNSYATGLCEGLVKNGFSCEPGSTTVGFFAVRNNGSAPIVSTTVNMKRYRRNSPTYFPPRNLFTNSFIPTSEDDVETVDCVHTSFSKGTEDGCLADRIEGEDEIVLDQPLLPGQMLLVPMFVAADVLSYDSNDGGVSEWTTSIRYPSTVSLDGSVPFAPRDPSADLMIVRPGVFSAG